MIYFLLANVLAVGVIVINQLSFYYLFALIIINVVCLGNTWLHYQDRQVIKKKKVSNKKERSIDEDIPDHVVW